MFKRITSAAFLAILMLAAVFSSCSSKSEEEYRRKELELDIKTKELQYLKELYSLRSDIQFEQKMKTLDSLIANCR